MAMTPSSDADDGIVKEWCSIANLDQNRLFLASFKKRPRNTERVVHYWLASDKKLLYKGFYDDFGPLKLSALYHFCQTLHELMASVKSERKIFVVAVKNTLHARVNGAYLVASYMMIYHSLSAVQAYQRVKAFQPEFLGFVDASLFKSAVYFLQLRDVLEGVEVALRQGWLDFSSFDAHAYEHYERVENGDLNWVVPGRVLAFQDPHLVYTDSDDSDDENDEDDSDDENDEDDSDDEDLEGFEGPEFYFNYFRDHNVTTIVRLNEERYDSKSFTDAGFTHHELYFKDGSTPSDSIVQKFIDTMERAAPGAVAVHCKSGLGRTGTLIACWMMAKFHLTAPQCMAWLRICRPGSVIGQQQLFLVEKQEWCWGLLVAGDSEKSSPEPAKGGEAGNERKPGSDSTSDAEEDDDDDETRANERGQTQGDRLQEIKAKAQQSGGKTPPSDSNDEMDNQSSGKKRRRMR